MKTRLLFVSTICLMFSGCGLKSGDTIVNEKLASIWDEEKSLDEYHRLSMDSVMSKPGDPKEAATSDYHFDHSKLIAPGSALRVLETKGKRAKVKVMLDAQSADTARLFGVEGKVGWIDLERFEYNKR